MIKRLRRETMYMWEKMMVMGVITASSWMRQMEKLLYYQTFSAPGIKFL
jgi:hypothetical protein